MTNIKEIMPLILAGDGFQLTIDTNAQIQKMDLLAASSKITAVNDNDDSARAQRHTRSLAAMRIEVEKSRKLVKEPVNRIAKLIDAAAADFLAGITAEEGRIKQLIGRHAEEVLRIKAELEVIEKAAFDAARSAREAANGGGIAAVLADKKATADKLECSNQVAAAKVAAGVSFAWDFEVDDINVLHAALPYLCDITPRRASILAACKNLEADGYEVKIPGIRPYKKPTISSR